MGWCLGEGAHLCSFPWSFFWSSSLSLSWSYSVSFSKSSSLVIIFDNLTVIFLCPYPFHLLGHILGHLSSHIRCHILLAAFSYLLSVSPSLSLSFPSLRHNGSLVDLWALEVDCYLCPHIALGFLAASGGRILGTFWDPGPLLRLTPCLSLSAGLADGPVRYPVALCTSRNCVSGGSLGGPSHAVVLHQHFYHLEYVLWYRVPQSYLLVHRIAHWSQVAVLYGCVKFLVSGCRCHRWCNARKPCDYCVSVCHITCEGVLEVLWFSCPQLLGEWPDLSLNSPGSE